MAKYIIQGKTLKAIADEVRDLVDITDEINTNEMITNMEQANADVAAQTEIIEQIRTALDGKAGSNAAEIGVIIDNSGVLDSTEGTVEEKVEQLIDLAKTGGVDSISTLCLTRFAVGNLNTFDKPTVELNLPLVPNYYRMFKQTILNTTVEHIIVNGMQEPVNDEMIETFYAASGSDNKIKQITLNCNLNRVDDFGYCFCNLTALEIIDGTPIDCSTAIGSRAFDYAFSQCRSLRELRVKRSTIKTNIYFSQSTELSNESIQSIIDGLADLTGQTARNLTLHADVKAKLTQTQLDTITGKNWNLA